MNKQEAIRELMSKSREIIFGDDENVYLSRKRTIELVSQIDEPQKVTIPKFVAEWIEAAKKTHNNISWVWFSRPSEIKIQKWLDCNTEKFLRAYLEVYEIEPEKLYTVEIPNPNSNWKYTFLTKKDNRGVIIFRTDDDCWKKDKNNQLTEAEIKQDFEWAWKWAEPVEEN